MAGHTNWKRFRNNALTDPDVRAGYERADRAILFGDAVRQARESVGISQAELARRMNTGQPTIARLELGGVDPKLSTIERISRALGADLILEFAVSPANDPSVLAPPIPLAPVHAPAGGRLARAAKDGRVAGRPSDVSRRRQHR